MSAVYVPERLMTQIADRIGLSPSCDKGWIALAKMVMAEKLGVVCDPFTVFTVLRHPNGIVNSVRVQ